MNIYLVTGGAGFIGSHIVDLLLSRGQRVRVLDDFSSGKRANVRHCADQIQLRDGSLLQIDTVRQAVMGVDYVLHQAAIPSVLRSIEDPIRSNTANIDGTLNLLVAARDAGVKRLVFASSSSVYGDSPSLPKVETMTPAPLSPYALTKHAGEEYCRLFTSLYGLETVSLRYFNVFGPRQDPQSQYSAVIPKFVQAMLKGKQPIIFGDGLQSRDFTYVSNNAEANLLACCAPVVAGDVFNIAGGGRKTLLELVEAINSILGTSIEPAFAPPRVGEVKHSHADIRKAGKALGFCPGAGFMAGLERVILSMRDLMQK